MNMNERRHVRRRALLSLAVALFIFSNSLIGPTLSIALSHFVARFLNPSLDPTAEGAGALFHFLLRKGAHVTEFALLGLSLGGFARALGRLHRRDYVALPLLLTLSAAVTDEFIQSFTGRTSSVHDVVLDFCGGLLGLGLMVLIARLRDMRSL